MENKDDFKLDNNENFGQQAEQGAVGGQVPPGADTVCAVSKVNTPPAMPVQPPPYTTPGYSQAYMPQPYQNPQQFSPYTPSVHPVQQPRPQWAAGQFYQPYAVSPPVQVPQNPYAPFAIPAAMPPQQQDTTKPLAVMARRRMSREEFRRIQTMDGGGKTAFFILAAILAILFGIISIFYAGETGDRVGLWLTVGLSALAGIGLILYPIWRHIYKRRVIDRVYACQQDDADEDMVTEIYADRIESIYSRGRSVVYFQKAVMYETADMLVLTGDGASIVFRASDITPEQLQVLYGIMLPRLMPGNRKNRGGYFFPRGVMPLPIPHIENRDKVLLSFVVPEEKEDTGYEIRSSFVKMLPFYLPLFTVVALYSANNIAISPSLIVDIGLNMLMFWVLGMLILLGVIAAAVRLGQSRRKKTDPSAAYAFTRDGMARRWAGGTIFVPRAYIKGICKKKGVSLMTPYGRYYIEWQDVADKDLLRAILNGDAPTQPPEGDQTNG